jgi:hypothetical protein
MVGALVYYESVIEKNYYDDYDYYDYATTEVEPIDHGAKDDFTEMTDSILNARCGDPVVGVINDEVGLLSTFMTYPHKQMDIQGISLQDVEGTEMQDGTIEFRFTLKYRKEFHGKFMVEFYDEWEKEMASRVILEEARGGSSSTFRTTLPASLDPAGMRYVIITAFE